MPFPDATSLANRFLYGLSLSSSEDEWISLALFAIVALPRVALRQVRSTITIVKAIDGAALIARCGRIGIRLASLRRYENYLDDFKSIRGLITSSSWLSCMEMEHEAMNSS